MSRLRVVGAQLPPFTEYAICRACGYDGVMTLYHSPGYRRTWLTREGVL